MYTRIRPARTEAMELCLCGVCAGAFFNDPQFRIRRADRSQTVRESCTYCGVRSGYDYLITRKTGGING